MSDFISGLFAAIFGVGGIILFFWGFYYVLEKYLGVRVTSRGNYRNAQRLNSQSHISNAQEISKYDEGTIKNAQENLSKKFYARTSDNMLEELRKFGPPKEKYYMPKAETKKLDYYGFNYKFLLYFNYKLGKTTYLRFSNNNNCICLVKEGVPNWEFSLSFNFGTEVYPSVGCTKISNE